jgi:hypothetical protein
MGNDALRFGVTEEQLAYAERLVRHSISEHRVANIWDASKQHADRSHELRFTGSLGETIFADLYGLPRPTRSFGAQDGQDYGSDFNVETAIGKRVVDVKTMSRTSSILASHYVLNIPARNLTRPDVVTTHYACISLHPRGAIKWATLLGEVARPDILQGAKGVLFKSGTVRTRADGTTFKFYSDTFEITIADLNQGDTPRYLPKDHVKVVIR